MADILIRGMEMPEYCYECPCHNGESGYCQLYKGGYLSSIERPAKCPLVDVGTPHGRLIDADAIEYTYTTARGNDDGHNWRIFAVGQDEVDDMPTIVPAEGGTDDEHI
jgi:hypothetical protein